MTTVHRRDTFTAGSTLSTTAVCALVMSIASVAGAQSVRSPVEPPPAGWRAPRLAWNESWPRVRAWEYIASGASYLGVLALQLSGRPTQANWTGDFLFDFAARDAFGTRDATAVSAWETVGDVPFYAAMAFPAVDAILVAGAIRGSWDVAWQMVAMDLEAFALALPLVYLTQYLVRRERPFAKYCHGDTRDSPFPCTGSSFTQSFPSGHVALVATSAALTCAHHTRLPIYDGGAGDVLVCVTWSSAAVLVGVARIAMNKHYVSDVLVGLGIGALAGYAVPVLLHYAMHDDDDRASGVRPERLSRRERTGMRFVLIPYATDRSLGLRGLGIF